ncbi:MAG: thiamine phosphate synthase, partial [Spirochaetes bacterium]|nr:thiamine phosphate synthase [Spirochaetota bacterium]
MTFDPRLCLVTERAFRPGGDFLAVLDAVLPRGVTLLQFRDKTGLGDRELLALGREVLALARKHRVPLIVNDRLDLAMALDADGVHLGQKDLPLALARKLWDPRRLFGISVNTPEQAREAAVGGAAYLGAGALLPTATKPD